MHCVSTVHFFVCINGEVRGSIVLIRGLRQGDLLSPYLFILCADGLSNALTEASDHCLITGVSILDQCPRISHTFFADDSLLFFRGIR